jgi:hypothetical protein
MEEHILRESIPKIREYIPKNYSQHQIHVFPLPMRHMLCPFQVLESKIHQEGVLDLVSHLHDEVKLLGLICNKVCLVKIIVHMP